jgi:hypothetical protein
VSLVLFRLYFTVFSKNNPKILKITDLLIHNLQELQEGSVSTYLGWCGGSNASGQRAYATERYFFIAMALYHYTIIM